MKTSTSSTLFTGRLAARRVRPLFLVIPAVLVVFAMMSTSSLARTRDNTDGGVSVTADAQSAGPGGVIVYTVTVKNGAQAGVVTVNDNSPPHTTLLDAGGCTDHNGGSVSCDMPL